MYVDILCLERAFCASPRTLFEAWTNADAWRAWFIPEGGPALWIEPPSLEARPGGAIKIAVRSEGSDYKIQGVFTELQPGRRLVFRWAWDRDFPITRSAGDTLVDVQFAECDDGGTIRLIHSEFPNEATREAHCRGWTRCFDGLNVYLSEKNSERSCTSV